MFKVSFGLVKSSLNAKQARHLLYKTNLFIISINNMHYYLYS
ncbi:hypothetical protein Leryth_016248 [Lithospermum erythrorhizon]|nr:hypothetical protein Leryth_016248 [Lithospermum erythrorhizon]